MAERAEFGSEASISMVIRVLVGDLGRLDRFAVLLLRTAEMTVV